MAKRYGSARPAKLSMTEDQVQEMVVKLLAIGHKDWIYQVNYLSGVKLSIGMAAKAKRLGHQKSSPDIMIFEPSVSMIDIGYHGLFLELKSSNTKLYNKTGDKYSSEHIAEQAEVLHKLRQKGYVALFAVGYDEAEVIISSYAMLGSVEGKIILESIMRHQEEMHEKIINNLHSL